MTGGGSSQIDSRGTKASRSSVEVVLPHYCKEGKRSKDRSFCNLLRKVRWSAACVCKNVVTFVPAQQKADAGKIRFGGGSRYAAEEADPFRKYQQVTTVGNLQ
jgi:hypothetical protein